MDNINDIISSLSNEDIEKLKNVASSILGDNKENESINDNKPNIDLSSSDLDMIAKFKGIYDKMNNASSKDADLIIALKPHLSDESKQKADRAVKILKLLEILPYIKDMF